MPRHIAPLAEPFHWLPLLPALLFVPMILLPPLNHDVAAVLQFSERWLAGERLYVDLIDINPPLIFVLNLIPAAISAVTPLGGVLALQVCLFVYGGLCWLLTLRSRDRTTEGPVEQAFLDVLPALFLSCVGYDFGQREHLMALAALPYAIVAARRARGEIPHGRFAIALVAGLAFALKPHFLGIPALVELYVLYAVRRRWVRDPVPWVMAGVWAIYLGSLPLLFPDYISSVLPLVWSVYLDLGGTTVWQVLLTQHLGTAIVLLVPLLWLTLRRRTGPGAMLPSILAIAASAALAAAIVQHKGWRYQILPAQIFICAIGGILAAQWFDARQAVLMGSSPDSIAAALAGLFALYAVSSGEAPWRELNYPTSEVAGLAQLLEDVAPKGRVLVLSPDVYPIFPALNYIGARSTLPAMSTWMLQGSYPACLPDGRHYREVWEMGQPELLLYRDVIGDFVRNPPAVVLVDTNTGIPWCGGPFDFIGYFARNLQFARTWSHFRMTSEWSHYRLYAQSG